MNLPIKERLMRFLHTGMLLLASNQSGIAQVSTSQPSSTHRLQFTLVVNAGEAGETQTLNDPSRHKDITVFKAGFLSEADLVEVHRESQGDDPMVSLTLTDAGGAVLHRVTSTHLHHQLAIVLDKQIICCATIQATINKGVVISLPDGSNADDADRIVKTIKQAMEQASAKK